jgi:hypothetical protein
MIKYTFLRKSNGHANGCIAYKLDNDTNTVQYGVSCLHSKEKFNRTLARTLAEENMRYSFNIKFECAGLLYKAILENIIAIDKADKVIIKNAESTISILSTPKRNFSDRVIKAAKLWLRINKRQS